MSDDRPRWEYDFRVAMTALAALPPAPVRVAVHPILWTAIERHHSAPRPRGWSRFGNAWAGRLVATAPGLPVDLDPSLDPAWMRVRWSNGRETIERATRDDWPRTRRR